jgi:hypothetical protein
MVIETKRKLEKLLDEYQEQRVSLKAIITDLEKFRVKIEKLFPESMDNRYVRFFDEKVKAVTELYKAILDIRKEITKNIKDEFDLVRKLELEEREDDNKVDDIRALAKELEKLNKSDKIRLDQTTDEQIH